MPHVRTGLGDKTDWSRFLQIDESRKKRASDEDMRIETGNCGSRIVALPPQPANP